jgi:hypothetical protein
MMVCILTGHLALTLSCAEQDDELYGFFSTPLSLILFVQLPI